MLICVHVDAEGGGNTRCHDTPDQRKWHPSSREANWGQVRGEEARQRQIGPFSVYTLLMRWDPTPAVLDLCLVATHWESWRTGGEIRRRQGAREKDTSSATLVLQSSLDHCIATPPSLGEKGLLTMNHDLMASTGCLAADRTLQYLY